MILVRAQVLYQCHLRSIRYPAGALWTVHTGCAPDIPIRGYLFHPRHQRSILHRQGAKNAKSTPSSFGSAFICLVRVICVLFSTAKAPRTPSPRQVHSAPRSSVSSASSAFYSPPPRRQERQVHARFIRLRTHLFDPRHLRSMDPPGPLWLVRPEHSDPRPSASSASSVFHGSARSALVGSPRTFRSAPICFIRVICVPWIRQVRSGWFAPNIPIRAHPLHPRHLRSMDPHFRGTPRRSFAQG